TPMSQDGKIMINTSETSNMAHFIDTATRQIVANVLVDARPRFAEFKRDNSELWVSSELRETGCCVERAGDVHNSLQYPGPAGRTPRAGPHRQAQAGEAAFHTVGPSKSRRGRGCHEP